MTSLLLKHHWLCHHYHSRLPALLSQAQLSSAPPSLTNFRQTVSERKKNARKLVILENLNHPPDFNKRILNVDSKFLSEKLNTDIVSFRSWTFQRRNFFLLQLNSIPDVQELQSRCGFNLHSFPLRTRMIEASIELPSKSDNESRSLQHYQFSTQLGKQLTCAQMREKYSSSQLVDFLTKSNTLSELDLQLRYFIISQLEEALCKGVFSDFNIKPFGSSLVGLGDSTSDLDIALLCGSGLKAKDLNFSMSEVKSERDQVQQSLSLISDIMRYFLPNFSQIQRILRARVPIVKTTFDLAPIDIDISVELTEGAHGFIMANYLAYCTNFDPVIKQLFVLIRAWARTHGVVKSLPGIWFSNFQLITLAMYFLQSKNILQSMDKYEQKTNTTTPPKPLPPIERLLFEFFEFLVSFNFEKDGISILEAKSFSKPDHSPLYIENPIERDLNICKNLVLNELIKLQLLTYNSLDVMCGPKFHFADLFDVDLLKKLEKQSQEKSTQ